MSDEHQSQTLCFLKLYSVCSSSCCSLVSDASDSVVGMVLTQVKDDDDTHSPVSYASMRNTRFSSTRARQLFFEKEIYGILLRLSHSHLLVVYNEWVNHMNNNQLSGYLSVMTQYHVHIQNIAYIMINYLSPVYEQSFCVDML